MKKKYEKVLERENENIKKFLNKKKKSKEIMKKIIQKKFEAKIN